MIDQRTIDVLKYNVSFSSKPSLFLESLRMDGILSYYPELASMVGVPQEPEWHPEGDVWTHVKMVMDEAAVFGQELNTNEDKEIFMFGALCHDLGKPYTTIYTDGRWRSPKHDTIGAIPTRSLLYKLGYGDFFIEEVVKYVVHHLKPSNLYKTRDFVSLKAIGRLVEKIDLHKLVLLAKSDHFGRSIPESTTRESLSTDWLLDMFEKYKQSLKNEDAVKPLVTGKMLLSLNIQPGRQMGAIIDQAFDLQMNGIIKNETEALAWARKTVLNINGNKKN